jgi:hypothetical protein
MAGLLDLKARNLASAGLLAMFVASFSSSSRAACSPGPDSRPSRADSKSSS